MLRKTCRIAALATLLTLGPHAAESWAGGVMEQPAPTLDKPEGPGKSGALEAKLNQANRLLRFGDYARARALFHDLAEDRHVPARIAEAARFGEAETLRLQRSFVQALAVYQRVIANLPPGSVRQQTNQRLFDIANYWLDDTREEMAASNPGTGQSSVVPRFPFGRLFHLDRTKPFFNEEGAALKVLEQVWHNDPRGPLAARALFMVGCVRFFRADYEAAARYFTTCAHFYPNDALTAKAIELAIIGLQMSIPTGHDDGSRTAEIRDLIAAMRRDFPVEAAAKEEFLERQLYTLNCAEAQKVSAAAAKELSMARGCERAGVPELAQWLYADIYRRYPETRSAAQACQWLQRPGPSRLAN